MRRRDFVIALGSVAAVSAPLLGRAQQTGKTYHIAIVSISTPVAQMIEGGPFNSPLFQELRRRGYVEGRNLVVELHSGEGKGRYAELAAEVIRSKPDLIYAHTTTQAMAFKAATTTIPIVAIDRPGRRWSRVEPCTPRWQHHRGVSRCRHRDLRKAT